MDRALDMYVREFGAELLMDEIVDAEVIEDDSTSEESASGLDDSNNETSETIGLPSTDDGVDSSEEE